MIYPIEKYTKSVQETYLIASDFARLIDYKGIVILNGELGSGKTVFTRGIIHSLNNNITVNSPSFTIINTYNFGNYEIYHSDLYRLSEIDLYSLQLLDIIKMSNVLVLVEWGDILIEHLSKYYTVLIEYCNNISKRRIIIDKIIS